MELLYNLNYLLGCEARMTSPSHGTSTLNQPLPNGTSAETLLESLLYFFSNDLITSFIDRRFINFRMWEILFNN